MRAFRYFALLIFFLDLPVPLYWFAIHPFGRFWRRRIRAAFWIAGIGAWTCGGIFVALFWKRLIGSGAPSILKGLLGIAMISTDIVILRRVTRELGQMTLVGHSELTGKQELRTEGIYARIRHPRYTAMIAAVAGACILAGTRFAWITGFAWLALVLTSIFLEERELKQRFGAIYLDYARRVPRFVPMWRK
jgi:protein-S-isoprenylcysteine O-methyltransferase Ste14